jgi:predicted phage terminase large subunit-like protein
MTTERELVDILYRNSFAAFCCEAFRVLNPGKTIVPNWHIQAVCYVIEGMVKGDARNRLVLNLPPRSLKSFIVSGCLPAWLLGRDPTIRILCASYSQNLANKHSRDCRTLMQSAFYKRVFPRTELNPQKISEGEFETTRHGFRLATSVGGTLTGRGGSILIIDDPINAEDGVASQVALEGANDWFHNTALSRLDSDDALIIVVQQRLHQDDLSGILIEKGWPCLAIPAIATETESYLIGEDEFYERKAGEVLQPKRQTREALEEKQREVGSSVWAAQYQQNPTPSEGNLIKRNWLVPFDFSPTEHRFEQIILACDPAGKPGAKNDYTAIVVCGIERKTVHVLHVARGRWTVMSMVERIKQLVQDWKVDLSIVEDTSSGMGLVQILREHQLNVIGRRPDTDKETRVLRHQGWFEAGKIRFPKDAPWLADLEEEILGFPGARYDDQVDALLLLLDWYAKRARYESLAEVPVGLPYVGNDSIRNSDSDYDIDTTICGVYDGRHRIRNSDSDHAVDAPIIGVYVG